MFGRRNFFRGLLLGTFAGIVASLVIDWDKVRERGQEVFEIRGIDREKFREDLKDKLNIAREMAARSYGRVSEKVSERMGEKPTDEL